MFRFGSRPFSHSSSFQSLTFTPAIFALPKCLIGSALGRKISIVDYSFGLVKFSISSSINTTSGRYLFPNGEPLKNSCYLWAQPRRQCFSNFSTSSVYLDEVQSPTPVKSPELEKQEVVDFLKEKGFESISEKLIGMGAEKLSFLKHLTKSDIEKLPLKHLQAKKLWEDIQMKVAEVEVQASGISSSVIEEHLQAKDPAQQHQLDKIQNLLNNLNSMKHVDKRLKAQLERKVEQLTGLEHRKLKKKATAATYEDAPLDTEHPNFNRHITDILEEMALINKNKGLIHKYKAYMRASTVLKAHPKEIKSGEEAMELKGVGKKLADKIDQILETGKLEELEVESKDEHVQAINLISRVPGIGPSAAKKMVIEEGVRTLEDLKNVKLTHHQQIGLKYFEDLTQKVPRSEIELHEKHVFALIHEVDPKTISLTCGSYRRGLPEAESIEILFSHPDFTEATRDTSTLFHQIIERLKERKYLVDDIQYGNEKYMGICILPQESGVEKPIHRRIHFRWFPIESFHCGLLYYTGSELFNSGLRLWARKKGYRLSEYALCPMKIVGETEIKGDPFPVNSEEDIFKQLGLNYREPKDRSI